KPLSASEIPLWQAGKGNLAGTSLRRLQPPGTMGRYHRHAQPLDSPGADTLSAEMARLLVGYYDQKNPHLRVCQCRRLRRRRPWKPAGESPRNGGHRRGNPQRKVVYSVIPPKYLRRRIPVSAHQPARRSAWNFLEKPQRKTDQEFLPAGNHSRTSLHHPPGWRKL